MYKLEHSLPAMLTVCLLAAGCDSGSGQRRPVQQPVFTITYQVGFSPLQVVGGSPSPESVTATADIFSARDDATTLNGSVTISGATATSVTVREGFPGEAGGQLLALTNDGGDVWVIPEASELDDAEFDRLNGSGYYVSIQSPEGELRGQVLLPGLIPATVPVDDSRVIPSAESSGRATAGFLLDPGSGFVRLRLSLEGVDDATTVGLRGAISGAIGEVIVPMEVSLENPAVWGTADINDPDAREFLTQQAASFVITGSSYFSVETISNPDGELRGQLLPQGIEVVDVTLDSGQVIRDGPAVESNAQALATVTWNPNTSQLSVAVNTDIDDAVSVGVYQAAAGEIGPLVLSLMPDVMLPGNWFVELERITPEQATALSDELLYVSIVTEEYSEGELRGQISLDAAE